MVATDRLWLYAGLAGAVGFGVARLLTSPRLRQGDRVLLVGDSMAVGLSTPLAALAKDRGVVFQALAKEGTRIDQWAHSAALHDALEQFQPTLVLVSLGTNDEYMTAPGSAERQKPELETLLNMIDRFPRRVDFGLGPEQGIVWIGPPALPKDQSNGILAILKGDASILHPRYRYFPSQRLPIPRGPDQLHPTARGYAAWAGAIWQWLS